ncbi:MAG: methylated-DNA--[protein]-cysteine S-methyltransferase [Clostridia bacterium]|jgi:methylated-DNA-[protein]-cysteine S-methyltransferase|nr:methylated-DNA--[protein]-cysteine S-methyltransferase [Clostridia bacterium]
MYKAYYHSPIGIVEMVSDENSIIALSFVEEAIENNEQTVPKVLQTALEQMDEYFQGKRKVFNLELKAEGTEFQQKVWRSLVEVPYGETACYGDIAKAVGNNKGSRAVGGANNKNKIAIIIPCHRIIGADGSLTGYAGGLWRKEWLLKHEKNHKSYS